MPSSPDFGLVVGAPPEEGPVSPREALGWWLYPSWPLYENCLAVTRCGRLCAAMSRVWGRLRAKLLRRVGLPPDFKLDQFAFLDDEEVTDVQRFINLMMHGGITEGPVDTPSFTGDAVATRPPYLRSSDAHVHHFDRRFEKDIRRGFFFVILA